MRFSIPFQNYVRDRKAAAAVEFVLVFPWFIFFVLLTAELGLFFFTSSTVEQAIHNYSRKIATMEVRQLTAAHADAIEQEILTFVGAEYPPIVQSWRRNWDRITPFFDYSPEIRRIIYTTNAIESVNMSLRKITKNRGSFPSDDALLKLFYLALANISPVTDAPFPGISKNIHAAEPPFPIDENENSGVISAISV